MAVLGSKASSRHIFRFGLRSAGAFGGSRAGVGVVIGSAIVRGVQFWHGRLGGI